MDSQQSDRAARLVGFVAVALFGHGTWANLAAVVFTVAAIALDALDGHIARKKQMATPLGAQVDVLGDRMIENMFFTYFAVVGMVSLWLPVLFFARGAATDFLRGLAFKAGHSGWGANAMLQTWWGRALVASRWSRGLYAALKCACFCYLGLELALTRGPVALLGTIAGETHLPDSRNRADSDLGHSAFCLLRGLPVLLEGWQVFFARSGGGARAKVSGGGGMSIAFFDIDGTLLAKPSLERRFFRELRRQRRIPAGNYFAWLAEAVRLAPRDAWAATHANKMYLRGVSAEALCAAFNNPSAAWLLGFFSRGDAARLVACIARRLDCAGQRNALAACGDREIRTGARTVVARRGKQSLRSGDADWKFAMAAGAAGLKARRCLAKQKRTRSGISQMCGKLLCRNAARTAIPR